MFGFVPSASADIVRMFGSSVFHTGPLGPNQL